MQAAMCSSSLRMRSNSRSDALLKSTTLLPGLLRGPAGARGASGTDVSHRFRSASMACGVMPAFSQRWAAQAASRTAKPAAYRAALMAAILHLGRRARYWTKVLRRRALWRCRLAPLHLDVFVRADLLTQLRKAGDLRVPAARARIEALRGRKGEHIHGGFDREVVAHRAALDDAAHAVDVDRTPIGQALDHAEADLLASRV